MSRKLRDLASGFTRTFWVANGLELFERFAFYGSKAVLTIYLAQRVGLGPQAAGSLAGLFSGVLYFLPILAGTVVDRYGFKKSLAACFSIFCVGYFLIGMAGLQFGQSIVGAVGRVPYILAVLMLTAVGGSLIKPCIVGTVASTTTPQTKALGYSIYYTMVNFGGAMGPILALQVRQSLGIEYVLVVSSITSFFCLLGTLIFFREPERAPGEAAPTSFGKVLRDMLLVFRNGRFIGFLVIFSGFWIMFWQMFYSLPFYLTESLHFERFELIETVDAWTLILVTVPIAALVRRWRPIRAMTAGFFVASCSWLIIAFLHTWQSVVVAMFVLALGEAMQAPRFYEYVADLAPRDQVGTFMGFAFLPVAIGSVVGGVLAGSLVERFVRHSTQPSAMWWMISAIGFAATVGMVLYDRFVAGPTKGNGTQPM
ncbi:MAG TPA: MFS transporter [Thermoanaerobaculia bacterium]|jgi:dipeptide/tripeptide permease|nr:MFS transporter [Thermoanaerobaculia bacterium]